MVINGFKYDEFLNELNATSNLGSQVPPPTSEQNGFMYNNFLNDLNATRSLGQQVPPPASDQNSPLPREIDNTVSNINAASYLSGDLVLGYISRMLMEEDIDEKLNMFQDYPALLEAVEKPFYEILVPSPDRPGSKRSSVSSDGDSTGSFNDPGINNGAFDCNLASVQYPLRPSCYSTSNGASNTFDHSDMFSENMFAFQFRRGVEEARKFLPRDDNLVVNLEGNRSSLLRSKSKEGNQAAAKVKKTRRSDELDSEEKRNTKQTAVYDSEETRRSKMVLLCPGEGSDKGLSARWTSNFC